MDQFPYGGRQAVALALAALSCAAGAVDLSEQQAVARTLARPAFAEAAAGRLAAAQGAVTVARQLPNPVVSIERERMPAPGGHSIERTAGISQSVDLFGRRSLRVEAAEQRVAATRHDLSDRRVRTIAEVRRAFAEALHGERRQQSLAAWLKRIDGASGVVARLSKSGEVSGYARRRMEREAQAASARLAGGTGDAARAREQLRGMVGLDPAEGLTLTGVLMPDAPPPLETVAASFRQRPDLASLKAQAEAFERERQLADRAWAPAFVVGIGQKQVDEPTRNDTGLVLSLSFQLPLFDRGEGVRDIAAAQVRTLRAEHALTLGKYEAELRGLWQQASELRAGAGAARAAPVSDLARTAETAYRAGEGGILELLDAYRSELEAELGALDLELRARLARIELDAFSGVDRAN